MSVSLCSSRSALERCLPVSSEHSTNSSVYKRYASSSGGGADRRGRADHFCLESRGARGARTNQSVDCLQKRRILRVLRRRVEEHVSEEGSLVGSASCDLIGTLVSNVLSKERSRGSRRRISSGTRARARWLRRRDSASQAKTCAPFKNALPFSVMMRSFASSDASSRSFAGCARGEKWRVVSER